MIDYYKVLEVPYNATCREIDLKYKHLSLKWHPYANPDDKDAATKRLNLITKAYKVLSDKKKRRRYEKEFLLAISSNNNVCNNGSKLSNLFSFASLGSAIKACVGYVTQEALIPLRNMFSYQTPEYNAGISSDKLNPCTPQTNDSAFVRRKCSIKNMNGVLKTSNVYNNGKKAVCMSVIRIEEVKIKTKTKLNKYGQEVSVYMDGVRRTKFIK